MLMPKRTKYRKSQRGTMKGNAQNGTKVSFGEFGLMAEGTAWVSARQIEASRRAITHYTQRGGKLWIRVFPYKAVTKKPPEVRMGSGKGDIHQYVAPVRPGRILFEMSGVTKDIAKEALRLAGRKLPMKTRMVFK